MPQILQTIDEIARELKRDVLMMVTWPLSERERLKDGKRPDFRRFKPYLDAVQWLESNSIEYRRCYPLLGPGYIQYPYCGELFLDIPNDPAHPDYQKLISHWETPDGEPRLNDTIIYLVPLKLANSARHKAAAKIRARGDN